MLTLASAVVAKEEPTYLCIICPLGDAIETIEALGTYRVPNFDT